MPFAKLKELLSKFKESNNFIMMLSNNNFFISLDENCSQKPLTRAKSNEKEEKEPKKPKVSSPLKVDLMNEIDDNSEAKIVKTLKSSKGVVPQVKLPSIPIKIIYPSSSDSKNFISQSKK